MCWQGQEGVFNAVERAASGGGWEKPRTEGYCISVNAAQVELFGMLSFWLSKGSRDCFETKLTHLDGNICGLLGQQYMHMIPLPPGNERD